MRLEGDQCISTVSLLDATAKTKMNELLLATSRCPAKLILSGEHSTVYGKNAVAVTVDLYTEVNVFGLEDQAQVILVLRNFDLQFSWPLEKLCHINSVVKQNELFVYTEDLVSQVSALLDDDCKSTSSVFNACVAFLLLYLSINDASIYSQRKCLRVEVSSKLPNGAGLGSSSSYIVSLAKALFVALNRPISQEDFNHWCYQVDKLFHGKPSGVDNSICTYGGAILFGGGQIIEKVDGNQLASLTDLQVVLVNTNVPRNTKAMVEKCRKRLDLVPSIGPQILESIASVSQEVWQALKSKDLSCLPVLFELNQHLLNCLNVGHERIDLVVDIAKRHGFVAKLTGAGGGGVVMVYIAHQDETSLVDELQSHGLTCYKVKLGVTGVTVL